MRKFVYALIVVLVAAGIYIAQDWRLYARFAVWPQEADHPEDALWYEPKVPLGEGQAVQPPAGEPLDEAAIRSAMDYAKETETYALLAVHEGRQILTYYSDGMGPESWFQSQSLHKGLTTAVLGAAIGTGAIDSIDQPASQFIPEWRDDAEKSGITLAHLAYMGGGLERPEFARSPFAPGAKLFITSRLRQQVVGTPMVAAPGEAYVWSNASTQALSIAIEAAVGKRWRDFLEESIWNPIGGGLAYVQLDRPGGTAQSFCCLIATAPAWLRVGQLLANDGNIDGKQVLPKGWVKQMATPADTNPNYGMQLWVNEPYTGKFLRSSIPPFSVDRAGPLAADDAFFIEGHFAQRVYVVPSLNLAVVRLGKDVLPFDDTQLLNPIIDAMQKRSRLASDSTETETS